LIAGREGIEETGGRMLNGRAVARSFQVEESTD
jgi:hypothetical protein